MNDKEILANAPKDDKATITFTICEDKQRVYVDDIGDLIGGYALWWAVYDGVTKEFDCESRYIVLNDDVQSLADIQRIVEFEAKLEEAIKINSSLSAEGQARFEYSIKLEAEVRRLNSIINLDEFKKPITKTMCINCEEKEVSNNLCACCGWLQKEGKYEVKS